MIQELESMRREDGEFMQVQKKIGLFQLHWQVQLKNNGIYKYLMELESSLPNYLDLGCSNIIFFTPPPQDLTAAITTHNIIISIIKFFMIRIIEPEEYVPESERDIEESGIDLSKLQQSQSEHSSEDDMEVEIVNTEEIANERVYRFCNRVLILIVTVILAAFFVESLRPLTVKIGDVQYTEVQTIYTAEIGESVQPIVLLIPDQEEGGQAQKTAELCLKHQAKDCWRELLLSRGFMFIEVQKWLTEHPIQRNILVFWEERLALSILILALRVKEGQRIDVLTKQEHQRTYIDSLRINLDRYQIGSRVKFINPFEITKNFLAGYGLVIGSHSVLDNVIYPESLQWTAWDESQQELSNVVSDFITYTNLLLFYEQNPSDQAIKTLGVINNQARSIKLRQSDYEIVEEEVKDFEAGFFIIFLNQRMKKASQLKQDEIVLEKTRDNHNRDQALVEQSHQQQTLQKWQALKQVRRMKPQKIYSFFLCSQSNRDSVSLGQYYETEFNNIRLIKSQGESYLSQSHFYNFVYHLLIANDLCNVLDAWQDEMLANIIASSHRGDVFTPANSRSFIRINGSIAKNRLRIKTVDSQISQTMIEGFIINREIKLSFISLYHFVAMYNHFIFALKNNMNIVMKLQGSAEERQFLQELLQEFYVFVVFGGRQAQYDVSCIRNYQVEYYDQKQYPEHSYLFISKQDVSFEDLNPSFYFEAGNHRIGNKKYPCLRNFTTIKAEQTFHLRKGSKTLIIDSRISIFLDGDSDTDTFISLIKKQQGITQFFRNSLHINDKIAVFGEAIQSPYLLASILWKLNGNGEIYFFNPPSTYAAYVQKLIQLNRLETISEFVQSEIALMQLQVLLNDNEISVLILQPEVLAHILKVVEGMPELLILVRYEEYSKDLEKMMLHFNKNKQLKITEIQRKANKYNLCANYETSELKENQFAKEAFANSGWIAIIP